MSKLIDPTPADPTPTGWALAEVLEVLPEPWARDLDRLIAQLLHEYSTTDIREIRLGLIVELVLEDGQAPSWDRYDEAREQRAPAGQVWPDRTTLSAHYGGWVGAVRAAMDLYRIGGRARIPYSRLPAHEAPPPYTREEIERALIKCMLKLGHRPVKQEYVEWSSLERRASRETGSGDPRFPDVSVIRRRYRTQGGYDRALRLAHLRYSHEQRNADDRGGRRTNTEGVTL